MGLQARRIGALTGAVLARPGGRATNLTLLLALTLAFGTGVGAIATGSPRGRWIVVAHGVVAITVVVLIPWKGRVVRHGLRRTRGSRWVSLVLAALTVTTLLAGVGHSTGLLRSVGGVRGMWLHVATALALAPLALWHVLARPARPRASDLSRRTVLRLGLLGSVSAVLYAGLASAVGLTGLAGARRRFTGSYEAGSFDPPAMPTTIWLDDVVPRVDPLRWRLVVVDGAGRRALTVAQLSTFDTRWRATLDCTSGWYAHQDWTGVPVSALLRDAHAGAGDRATRSILVRSVTGYWLRLPVDDLDRLFLATGVGGAPLSPGHGYPLRLVAPGRRGFWWVKWVDRIELQATPPWWQPPFPIT